MKIAQIVADFHRFNPTSNPQGRQRGAFIQLNDEYVELHNPTNQVQDISRWVLRDANRHRFVFPEGTIVYFNATLRVRSGEGANTITDLFWGQRAPVWTNLGDTALLYDANGTLIDQHTFPDLTPETIARLPIQFRAETYPEAGAIALLWDIPLSATSATFPQPDALPLFILRRDRRYPGQNRRGVVPVSKQLVSLPSGVTPDDRSRLEGAYLTGAEDGFLVYDTVATAFEFDFEDTREEQQGDRHVVTRYQYRYQGESRDRQLIRSIRAESRWLSSSGERVPQRLTVRLIDREGVTPGTIYYYTAYVGPDYLFSRQTQASAMATARYGHSLFDELPQVHKQFDTVTPLPGRSTQADLHKGQLERLLNVFDAHADMTHGFIDGLRDLHHPHRVDSRLLPSLAHLLGWQFKNERNEERQRTELHFAPEIYKTVGTTANIAAIINLLTGWKTEVKEFSHNVLRSVDTRRFERLEGGVDYGDDHTPSTGDVAYLDGSLQIKPEYADYLNGERSSRPDPPLWQGRRLPPGSFDTRNENARAKLRIPAAIDNENVYSYHVPPADESRDELPDSDVLFNRETIGIYITADLSTEGFAPEHAAEQIYRIVREFLPIQVRPIIYIRELYEDTYDTLQNVEEGIESDELVSWRLFISNRPGEHHSVDTDVRPIDTTSRTWYDGIQQDWEIATDETYDALRDVEETNEEELG